MTKEEVIEAYKGLTDEDKAAVHAAIDLEIVSQVQEQGAKPFIDRYSKAVSIWFLSVALGTVALLVNRCCEFNAQQDELMRDIENNLKSIERSNHE